METDSGQSTEAAERIVIPLDTKDRIRAFDLIDMLGPYGVWFKLGLESMMASLNPNNPIVWNCVRRIKDMGGKVFLDPKFPDIPNTDAEATVAAIAALRGAGGIDAINMMANAGEKAMQKVIANREDVQVWAVTVPTSLDYADLVRIGYCPPIASREEEVRSLERVVLSMATRAMECGCQGIISSPRELPVLNEINLQKITPSIRSEDDPPDDQKRTLTAYEAALLGATKLVVGRPITTKSDPVKAMLRIAEDIERGLADRRAAGLGGVA